VHFFNRVSWDNPNRSRPHWTKEDESVDDQEARHTPPDDADDA